MGGGVGGGGGGGGQQPVGQRPEELGYTTEQMEADVQATEEPTVMDQIPETDEGPVRVGIRVYVWDEARGGYRARTAGDPR